MTVPSPTHRLVLVAEDQAIASAVTTVTDRAIHERAPLEWLRDQWEPSLHSTTRAWTPLNTDQGSDCHRGKYTKLGHLANLVPPVPRRFLRGAGGKAVVLAKAITALEQTASHVGAAAVVIAFDADDPDEAQNVRTTFAAECVRFADHKSGCALLLALAENEAESWWLAGFVPANPTEIAEHAAVCNELHLDPVTRAHELKSASATAKRKCKETFERLAGKPGSDRALACLEETSLDTLTKNGAHSGLARYIDDVRTTLCPALAAR